MSSYVMLPILSVISIVIVIKVGISKIIVSIVVVSKRVLLHFRHLKKKKKNQTPPILNVANCCHRPIVLAPRLCCQQREPESGLF
jgi:hypothetical protein